jgi:hypothetical protein
MNNSSQEAQKALDQPSDTFHDIDFKNIPSGDEFQKIKVKPENR